MIEVAGRALEEEGTVGVFIDQRLADTLEWLGQQPGLSAAERVRLQRAIRKLIDEPIPQGASKAVLRTFPVKDPDVVRIRNVGTAQRPRYKIDITEVYSPPKQSQQELLDRIDKAFELLPSRMAGNKASLPPVQPE
jgi:hypothetical protein